MQIGLLWIFRLKLYPLQCKSNIKTKEIFRLEIKELNQTSRLFVSHCLNLKSTRYNNSTICISIEKNPSSNIRKRTSNNRGIKKVPLIYIDTKNRTSSNNSIGFLSRFESDFSQYRFA